MVVAAAAVLAESNHRRDSTIGAVGLVVVVYIYSVHWITNIIVITGPRYQQDLSFGGIRTVHGLVFFFFSSKQKEEREKEEKKTMGSLNATKA